MEGPLRSGRLRTGPALAEQTVPGSLGSTITNTVESPAADAAPLLMALPSMTRARNSKWKDET